jgi:hypothetical protein
MTMSESRTIAEIESLTASLLEHQLLEPTPVKELRRKNTRRRRRNALGIGGSAFIVALAMVLLFTSLPSTNGGGPSIGRSINVAYFVRTTISVPDSVLKAVGRPSVVTPLISNQGQPLLNDGGKPVLVYVGSGFCPSCAFEQWALLVALSRFGSFSNLGQFILPPTSGGIPQPVSWSFTGSTYTSSVLTFEPAEIAPLPTTTPDGEVLQPQKLNHIQAKAIDDLEGPSSDAQSLPFTDVANRFWDYGFAVKPSNTWYKVLDGLSLNQVAADLRNSSSPVARVIDGAANYLIGDICAVVGTQSAPICSYDSP